MRKERAIRRHLADFRDHRLGQAQKKWMIGQAPAGIVRPGAAAF